MGQRRYCMNDDQYVQATKPLSLGKMIIYGILTLGLYIVYWIWKLPRCPKCHDTNWREPNGLVEKIMGVGLDPETGEPHLQTED